MQHDLFGSGYDLDLRSNFHHDLQEKHDAGQIKVVSLLSQKLRQKRLSQKRLFLEFFLSGGQTVEIIQNLRTISERTVKELSNALFPAL